MAATKVEFNLVVYCADADIASHFAGALVDILNDPPTGITVDRAVTKFRIGHEEAKGLPH